ncbi:hypothetical protein OFO10_04055 [Campylobacter sp. VBCF_06 NA8]|uniref:hypothetical protein n=1 Tax=unclassified Campylobacter TaxID=2593542 RepID=UPI0022E99D18|nr:MULTISPECIES: hypothetical protein [unclassified Campylobacter]MDA3046324.1 hypothetical protein [Campylobacter sp. VBCF_06 NA8]MDA3057010.1 hypothetical protein [Campylobacter sp. VBCF_04 NA7]MDA3059583.1 hypothetical protein [Campylobacter sp. VBCF_05 NA6]
MKDVLSVLFFVLILGLIIWIEGIKFVLVVGLPGALYGIFEFIFEIYDINFTKFFKLTTPRYTKIYSDFQKLTSMHVSDINKDNCHKAIFYMLKDKEKPENILKIIAKLRLEVILEQKGYAIPILKIAKQYGLINEIYDIKLSYRDTLAVLFFSKHTIPLIIMCLSSTILTYFVKGSEKALWVFSIFVGLFVLVIPSIIIIVDRILEYKARI